MNTKFIKLKVKQETNYAISQAGKLFIWPSMDENNEYFYVPT